MRTCRDGLSPFAATVGDDAGGMFTGQCAEDGRVEEVFSGPGAPGRAVHGAVGAEWRRPGLRGEATALLGLREGRAPAHAPTLNCFNGNGTTGVTG